MTFVNNASPSNPTSVENPFLKWYLNPVDTVTDAERKQAAFVLRGIEDPAGACSSSQI
jgi:hypothetical protein